MAVKTDSCIECGAALREGAAFCTACGASVPAAAAAVPAYESAACAECGKILRPNAAFCTGCGRSTTPEKIDAEPVPVGAALPTEAVDLTPAPKTVVGPPPPPSTVAAAARNGSAAAGTKNAPKAVPPSAAEGPNAGMVCGTCGKTQRPGSVTCSACGGKPAPVITEEARQSGPKEARTIRASVAGGAGSSYGMRTNSGGSATPPPKVGMAPLPPADDRHKRVVIAVAASLLLLVACAGIVFAALSSDDSGSVKASGSTSQIASRQSKRPGSGASTASDPNGNDSGAAVDTAGSAGPSTSDGAPSSTAGGTGTTQRPGSGGTENPGPPSNGGGGGNTGGGGGGGTTPPPPAPPTTGGLPPAILQVASSAVTIQGDAPSAQVRISNSGGQAYNFNTGTGGIPGGVSVSPASGTVPGGGGLDLTLTWYTAGTDEGFYPDGFLNVSSNVGLRRISVSADSRKGDEVSQWGWSGAACAGGSNLTYRVTFRAQGSAIPVRPPDNAAFDRTTVARSTLNGVPGTGDTFDLPQRQGTNPDTVTYRSRVPFTVNGGRLPQVEVKDAAGGYTLATWDSRCN